MNRMSTVVLGSAIFGLALFGSSMMAQETKQNVGTTTQTAKKIDQTGIKWVMPFSAAIEKAKQEKRLIAIKMIAGGTNKSGCW